MIDFLFALLGIAIALASLYPLLRTGGGMIAAFMRRTLAIQYAIATFVQLAALFGAALLAAHVSEGSNGAEIRMLSAVLMLVVVYAVDYVVRKTILKDAP
jgi:hypothetical protein